MRPDETRSFRDDDRTIDRNDPDELRAWAARLDATPEEIAAAIDKVGPNRTAVSIYLGDPNPL